MKKLLGIPLALFLAAATATEARAFDTIKTAKGQIFGDIIGMTASQVEIRQSTGPKLVKQIPVNEIESISYEGENPDLKTAKLHVQNGRYAEALAALERIKTMPEREEIRQDIEFYKAYCAAKLAMGGSLKIADAGRMMKAFADANPNSYHYFEASEVVGDLLVAVQSYAVAAEYYARLDKAPWPDYRMRSGVAGGRALLEQGKAAEAVAAFDKVIATQAEGEAAEAQRLAARLGKAAALVLLKKPDEAVQLVEEFLKQSDPEDAPMMARAYNVLGNAQRQAGRIKEALMAFLHVDVLYASVPDAHAEALANLAELWEMVHKTERANRARAILEEQYKGSPWAKKGG